MINNAKTSNQGLRRQRRRQRRRRHRRTASLRQHADVRRREEVRPRASERVRPVAVGREIGKRYRRPLEPLPRDEAHDPRQLREHDAGPLKSIPRQHPQIAHFASHGPKRLQITLSKANGISPKYEPASRAATGSSRINRTQPVSTKYISRAGSVRNTKTASPSPIESGDRKGRRPRDVTSHERAI